MWASVSNNTGKKENRRGKVRRADFSGSPLKAKLGFLGLLLHEKIII
jgi:hypothetical protein